MLGNLLMEKRTQHRESNSVYASLAHTVAFEKDHFPLRMVFLRFVYRFLMISLTIETVFCIIYLYLYI